MNDQQLAEPQEFTDEVIERAHQSDGSQPFQTSIKRPTYTVTIPVGGGQTKVFNVPDKKAMWSIPDKFLRTMAFNVGASPTTGVVTVTNEAGQHVARYKDREDALKRMKAAGVEVELLAGYERTFANPAEDADEEHDPGTDPENPILPPKRARAPRTKKQQEAE